MKQTHSSYGIVLLCAVILGVATFAATRSLVGQVGTSTCGNGVLESSEQCEDGNTQDGDLCSSTCTISVLTDCQVPVATLKGMPAFFASCKNDCLQKNAAGIQFKYCTALLASSSSSVSSSSPMYPPDVCGNNSCGKTETIASCPIDCPAGCGDGICDFKKEYTYCARDCRVKPIENQYPQACGDNHCHSLDLAWCPNDCVNVCGNGTCDAGNNETYETCANDCPRPKLPAECGNGFVDPGEACDDGNKNSGDGCSSICSIEGRFSCDVSPLNVLAFAPQSKDLFFWSYSPAKDPKNQYHAGTIGRMNIDSRVITKVPQGDEVAAQASNGQKMIFSDQVVAVSPNGQRAVFKNTESIVRNLSTGEKKTMTLAPGEQCLQVLFLADNDGVICLAHTPNSSISKRIYTFRWSTGTTTQISSIEKWRGLLQEPISVSADGNVILMRVNSHTPLPETYLGYYTNSHFGVRDWNTLNTFSYIALDMRTGQQKTSQMKM